MSYTQDKSGVITISGWEQGIGASPHKGLGNLQCTNIVTETGEVMCNYSRTLDIQRTINSGTFTGINTAYVYFVGAPTLQIGAAVNVGTGISGLNAGIYFVVNIAFGNSFYLATTIGGTPITGLGTSGNALFSTVPINKPIASTTEIYYTGSYVEQYRYYILDNYGFVWCYDTGLTINAVNPQWFLIDTLPVEDSNGTIASGLCYYNGFLHAFAGQSILYKMTSALDRSIETGTANSGWDTMSGILNTVKGFTTTHYAFVGHQSTLNYTDSNYIGTIFQNSTSTALNANIFTYGTYTASGSTITLGTLIAGNVPVNGQKMTVFSSAGSSGIYTGLTHNKIYYVVGVGANAGTVTFGLSATVGGSAISLSGGSGTQYLCSYDPARTTVNPDSNGAYTAIQTLQACTLPIFDVAQSMCEIGNQIVIGTQGNVLYLWDEITPQPQNLIFLPESNTVQLITVNNMAYAFSGQKGNVYITNGSTASIAFTVPDYVTGQIEPYYSWGAVMYVRGRVWFSLQDSNSTTGGVWSFVPSQNFFVGQDNGIALRLENQNSYGTYAGLATVLIPSFNQSARGVQYWSGWSNGGGGIDNSGTTPITPAVIETDLIPTGDMLDKKTFSRIEYKLATPLVTGESVSISYRQSITASYTSLGTAQTETSTSAIPSVSGYFPANFEKGQWIQLQITLTPTQTNPSFVRLMSITIR